MFKQIIMAIITVSILVGTFACAFELIAKDHWFIGACMVLLVLCGIKVKVS